MTGTAVAEQMTRVLRLTIFNALTKPGRNTTLFHAKQWIERAVFQQVPRDLAVSTKIFKRDQLPVFHPTALSSSDLIIKTNPPQTY